MGAARGGRLQALKLNCKRLRRTQSQKPICGDKTALVCFCVKDRAGHRQAVLEANFVHRKNGAASQTPAAAMPIPATRESKRPVCSIFPNSVNAQKRHQRPTVADAISSMTQPQQQ